MNGGEIRLKNLIEDLFQFLLWVYRYLRDCLKYGKPEKIEKITDRVVVCGNGPSIKEMDFEYYKSLGYEFLCVNFFALSEELFFKMKPKYYCMIDPGIFDDENYKRIEPLIHIMDKVSWNMQLIMLMDQKELTNNPRIKVIRINRTFLKSHSDRYKYNYYHANIASGGYQNVIIAALYYLITAQALEVCLVGVETDFHRELVVGRNNHVYRECVHFYGDETLDLQEAGEIKLGELYKYFYYYYLTLYQYYDMSKYAMSQSVKIVNLCVNSFIDVFQKKEMKSVCTNEK